MDNFGNNSQQSSQLQKQIEMLLQGSGEIRQTQSLQPLQLQKQKMIDEIEQILTIINKAQEDDSNTSIDPLNDPLLDRLAQIQRKSIIEDMFDVKRLCVLAVGKRLLMIQLRKQRVEFSQKQQKRIEIQDIFRENRIKKFNYPYLVQQKLKNNTFVLQPYSSGNGFVQSQNFYAAYPKALQDCEFLKVVRNVNKIFFKNFTGVDPKTSLNLNAILFRVIIFLFVIFFICSFLLLIVDFSSKEWPAIGVLTAMLAILVVVTINSYLKKPNENNQLEQTIAQIAQYFRLLNANNQASGKQFQWICPKQFMYLQIRFKNGIPSNTLNIQTNEQGIIEQL